MLYNRVHRKNSMANPGTYGLVRAGGIISHSRMDRGPLTEDMFIADITGNTVIL